MTSKFFECIILIKNRFKLTYFLKEKKFMNKCNPLKIYIYNFPSPMSSQESA